MSGKTIGPYSATPLKQTERPHPSCKYAVLDGYSNIIAWCAAREDADMVVAALNVAPLVDPLWAEKAEAETERQLREELGE